VAALLRRGLNLVEMASLALFATDCDEDYAELFWDVAGHDEVSLRLILEVAPIM
jgi:hypothetical protein